MRITGGDLFMKRVCVLRAITTKEREHHMCERPEKVPKSDRPGRPYNNCELHHPRIQSLRSPMKSSIATRIKEVLVGAHPDALMRASQSWRCILANFTPTCQSTESHSQRERLLIHAPFSPFRTFVALQHLQAPSPVISETAVLWSEDGPTTPEL